MALEYQFGISWNKNVNHISSRNHKIVIESTDGLESKRYNVLKGIWCNFSDL